MLDATELKQVKIANTLGEFDETTSISQKAYD
jgi:hypothetical protein